MPDHEPAALRYTGARAVAPAASPRGMQESFTR